MTTNRAHQKRLEKKKKERELAKRHARAREATFPTSMAGMARRGAERPFGPAFMSASWREGTDEHAEPSIVSVVVTRVLPDGDLVAGSLLVDRTCLGVKDAFVDGPLSRASLDDILERMARVHAGGIEEVSVHEAQSVVLHAVAFARSLGFAPHSDFAHARIVLGEPETLLDTPLSRPSAPIYVPGPHDDVARIEAQLDRVDARHAADLVAFAEPLLEATRESESEELACAAIAAAATFWNLSLMKDEAARAAAIEEHVTKSGYDAEELRNDYRALARSMVERHRKMFPEMHA